MASNSPTISIKLLIHQERNTVILAEASNDFVDTLRSFLTFPLGNIVRLVRNHQGLQPGCLNNIYKSVENPSMKCFRTDACRHMLLQPRNVHEQELKNLKLNLDLTEPTRYFICEICCKRPAGGVLSYYRTANCTCVSWNNKVAARGSDLVKDKSEGVLYKGESVLDLLGGGKGNLTLGSISKLFKELDNIYSITKQKDPQKGVLPPFYSCPKEFPNIFTRDAPTYYAYSCQGKYYITSNNVTRVPLKRLDPKSPHPDPTNSWGYVEKNSLFVVTDDLVVKSALSVSSISFLMELGIPLDDVEEQFISIGEVEAVSLLRASLCSSSALSALVNINAKQPKKEPL